MIKSILFWCEKMILKGDLVGRLCTPAEVRFYFSCLHDQKGVNNIFLNTTINCNQSSWVQGCEPGWTCSVSPDILLSNINSSMIPPRTTNCQQCCKGFFCPRGLTCMLREFFQHFWDNYARDLVLFSNVCWAFCLLPVACPLGSYCPHAKVNITTGLCDP